MTMHRFIVLTMLAFTTVLALLYVSTFPAAGEAPSLSAPSRALESGHPTTLPARGADGSEERRFDAEALRHLA